MRTLNNPCVQIELGVGESVGPIKIKIAMQKSALNLNLIDATTRFLIPMFGSVESTEIRLLPGMWPIWIPFTITLYDPMSTARTNP